MATGPSEPGTGGRLVTRGIPRCCPSREVAEREASGAALRTRAAVFPGHKLLEKFNFDHQPAADRNLVAHLGAGVFLREAKKVVLLGWPGTGKTQAAVGLGIRAVGAGHRVLFDTAIGWVSRPAEAHDRGRLRLTTLQSLVMILGTDPASFMLPSISLSHPVIPLPLPAIRERTTAGLSRTWSSLSPISAVSVRLRLSSEAFLFPPMSYLATRGSW